MKPWKTFFSIRGSAWRTAALVLGVAAMLSTAAAQTTQNYPQRPIRFILPVAVGGGTDIAARLFGQKLTSAFGQQVVVDNRAGAGGIIGTDLAAKAAPDGYTLLFAAVNHSVLPSLYSNIPYDAVMDFSAVSMLTAYPHLLVVHPTMTVKSVKELIALGKAKPGQINYASGGNGSVAHIMAELFKSLAGVNLVHVSYKGTGPAMVGLLAGEGSLAFYSISATAPHRKAGRLRALASTGKVRSSALPDLPTISEAGVPGYEAINWAGLLAPAKTPKPAINKLHGELVRTLQLPDVRQQLATLDFEPVGNSPAEFDALIKQEVAKWSKVIKGAGIAID